MKILLLQSYLGRKEPAVFPLGLSYLASYLSGHEVSAIDPNVESEPFDAIRKKLSDFKPEVIAISLRNIDTTVYKDRFYYYKALSATLKIIKQIVPGAYIVIGGAAFSLYAKEIMNRNPEIDFGVYLEGEETFIELLKNPECPSCVKGVYYRSNGKVLFSGLRKPIDFDKALLPNRDIFGLNKYYNPVGVGVQSKRGCSLDCAYCTYQFLTGKTIRSRVPSKVVDEIELINKDPETPILFADPVFNLPKQHAVEICQEIIRRKVKVKWSAYFSLQGMDEAFIELAQRAGCYLFLFSPDAYSDKSLKILRKEINKSQIKRAYNIVGKLKGARFDFSFFINPPGQDFLSFLGVIWLLLKTNFILPRRKYMHISVNMPRIEPHTELHKLSVKEGTLSSSVNLLPFDENSLSMLFYHNPNMRLVEGVFSLLLKMKHCLKKNRK